MNGNLTAYFLDGEQVLEETTASWAVKVQYTWGNGLIRRGSEFPMTDAQGTTKLTTDANQTVTSTQELDGFGRESGGTGSTASAFGFHGAEGYRNDGDGPAGLDPYQKVGARYYDRLTGRFLTRDTDLSQSPYAYCDGDPVNCHDPSGHLSIVNIAAGPMNIINGATGWGETAYENKSGDQEEQQKIGEAITNLGDAIASVGLIGIGIGFKVGQSDPGDPAVAALAESINAASIGIGSIGGALDLFGRFVGAGGGGIYSGINAGPSIGGGVFPGNPGSSSAPQRYR